MAAKILKGEATADSLPVVTATESKPFYNKEEVMEKLGLTLPEEYADATNLAE